MFCFKYQHLHHFFHNQIVRLLRLLREIRWPWHHARREAAAAAEATASVATERTLQGDLRRLAVAHAEAEARRELDAEEGAATVALAAGLWGAVPRGEGAPLAVSPIHNIPSDLMFRC